MNLTQTKKISNIINSIEYTNPDELTTIQLEGTSNVNLEFDNNKTNMSYIIKSILELDDAFINSLLNSVGISKEEIVKTFESSAADFSNFFKDINMSERTIINDTMIIFSMDNNDIPKMTELLTNGLNPNGKYRKNKHLVHFCKTPEMLELLLKHGLDLTLHKPLLYVPKIVFLTMIIEYNLDPYEYYYDFKDEDKIKYINRSLNYDRLCIKEIFSTSPLVPVLIDVIVDMCYISPKNQMKHKLKLNKSKIV